MGSPHKPLNVLLDPHSKSKHLLSAIAVRSGIVAGSVKGMSAVREVLADEDIYRVLRMGSRNKLVCGLCAWESRAHSSGKAWTNCGRI
ncbi:hypothetical protein COMA2_10038 [Candidatus Nitrospira nitrificans]|uniref:Uncharacterized protein n=1 Tax=Candidatus Nitrospira nitrificans TaxID=1742973 RepID=A0A0S4L100_9BACT|nr:hypothetical protein COMA2_10038 [Candidatus Nitrospira nitrificans]